MARARTAAAAPIESVNAADTQRLRLPTNGPHDADALGAEVVVAVGTLDFGAVRVPVPEEGSVEVEPTTAGRIQAVHVTVPEGRLSVSALAAPRTGGLWPDLAGEIHTSLREGGARVRSFSGEWGRELHATTDGATSVFVGVDGPRWMLYGVATGPTRDAVALDARLRQMLRGTVVVRGRAPFPVRTVLPLATPAPPGGAEQATSTPPTMTLRGRVAAGDSDVEATTSTRAPSSRGPTPAGPPAPGSAPGSDAGSVRRAAAAVPARATAWSRPAAGERTRSGAGRSGAAVHGGPRSDAHGEHAATRRTGPAHDRISPAEAGPSPAAQGPVAPERTAPDPTAQDPTARSGQARGDATTSRPPVGPTGRLGTERFPTRATRARAGTAPASATTSDPAATNLLRRADDAAQGAARTPTGGARTGTTSGAVTPGGAARTGATASGGERTGAVPGGGGWAGAPPPTAPPTLASAPGTGWAPTHRSASPGALSGGNGDGALRHLPATDGVAPAAATNGTGSNGAPLDTGGPLHGWSPQESGGPAGYGTSAFQRAFDADASGWRNGTANGVVHPRGSSPQESAPTRLNGHAGPRRSTDAGRSGTPVTGGSTIDAPTGSPNGSRSSHSRPAGGRAVREGTTTAGATNATARHEQGAAAELGAPPLAAAPASGPTRAVRPGAVAPVTSNHRGPSGSGSILDALDAASAYPANGAATSEAALDLSADPPAHRGASDHQVDEPGAALGLPFDRAAPRSARKAVPAAWAYETGPGADAAVSPVEAPVAPVGPAPPSAAARSVAPSIPTGPSASPAVEAALPSRARNASANGLRRAADPHPYGSELVADVVDPPDDPPSWDPLVDPLPEGVDRLAVAEPSWTHPAETGGRRHEEPWPLVPPSGTWSSPAPPAASASPRVVPPPGPRHAEPDRSSGRHGAEPSSAQDSALPRETNGAATRDAATRDAESRHPEARHSAAPHAEIRPAAMGNAGNRHLATRGDEALSRHAAADPPSQVPPTQWAWPKEPAGPRSDPSTGPRSEPSAGRRASEQARPAAWSAADLLDGGSPGTGRRHRRAAAPVRPAADQDTGRHHQP